MDEMSITYKWDSKHLEITHIVYESVNGEREVIELTEETRPMIMDLRREEENLMRRERRQRHDYMAAIGRPTEKVRMVYLDADEAVNWDTSAAILEMEHREQKTELRHAIEQLSPAYRDIIIKVFYHDIIESEIAENEGVGKSAISHRKKRALENLKKVLS